MTFKGPTFDGMEFLVIEPGNERNAKNAMVVRIFKREGICAKVKKELEEQGKTPKW